MKTLLMTGHRGLVGRYLKPLLERKGYHVRGFDLADGSGDISNGKALGRALKGCSGVVHLAAVSRVVWGERNPQQCWLTNALASEQLLKLATESALHPWVLVASSREVYGEPKSLPVADSAPVVPVNIYGRAKAYMEAKTLACRDAGITTGIVRLANVYGCTDDHADRVLPAFCHNAATGLPLRVDGFDHLFDFTHVTDTVDGITRMVEQLDAGEQNLPPVHLLPGVGTTLQEAAEMAVLAAGTQSAIHEAPSRQYDVCRFVGDPTLAKTLLGWKASVLPEQGITMLVDAFKAKQKQGMSV
ncbi:MAG: NAD(P)-dependent oxidoreductase [Oceanospirillaceae bacterium]|nr:NAD(P)-dependent oxidoreductase [Oceanospirillaceae bacterium]